MKKITAIVLCVLLAMSALVVLTACGESEYVVSFREYNSKIIFQGKTINGKAIEPKTPYKAGYDFIGWYKTLTAEEVDGQTVYTFADEMDFSKAVTADLDLYAKYEVSEEGVASSNPYYVVGNFAGEKPGDLDYWDGNAIGDLSRMLNPDNGALSATFVVTGKQEFKIKRAEPGWDGLNLGYSAVKSVTLASGVELPSAFSSVDELIIDGGGNIKVNTMLSKLGKNLKIKLTFVEAKQEISIQILAFVNSEEGPAQPFENGYGLVGKLGGAADNWGTPETKYNLTQGGEGKEHLYTLADLQLKSGDAFKIKEANTDSWSNGDYGAGNIASVTLADGVSLPAGIESVDELFGGSGNIEVAVDCTITLIYNFLNDTISIIVTAF